MAINESPNEFFTRLVWANLWNPKSSYYLPNVVTNGISQEGVTVGPLGQLSIASLPASGSFQLMQSQDLAKWLPIKTGYVGIEFADVVAQQTGSMSDGGLTYTDNPTDPNKGSIVAKINIPGLTINGNYTMVATGLAQCAIDTASILPGSPASETEKLTTAAFSSDDYVNAARDQRTRLWQTPNGGQLMDQFYDHNEAYNYVFQNNANMQTSWTLDTNQQFLQQTYTATQNPSQTVNEGVSEGDEVNDAGTSYNANAFNQQVTLAFACLYYAANPPSDGSLTAQQFKDAASSASQFGNQITTTTNNSSSNTVGMTVDQVFTSVSSADPNAAAAGLTLPGVGEDLLIPCTPEQEAYMKKVEALANARRAERVAVSETDAPATMVQGTCTLAITPGGAITINADLDFPPGGQNPTATITGFSAAFTVTAVNIDNQDIWQSLNGESFATQLINAYATAGSITSLANDKVNDLLGSDQVKNLLGTWLNDTLAKVLGPLTQ